MAEKILDLNKEKILFWTCAGLLLLCAGLYMYMINMTVHNVVARQNFENTVSQLTLSIGTKEFQYISLRNTITLPLAYSLGFKDTTNKVYVNRGSGTQVSFAN